MPWIDSVADLCNLRDKPSYFPFPVIPVDPVVRSVYYFPELVYVYYFSLSLFPYYASIAMFILSFSIRQLSDVLGRRNVTVENVA